MLSTTKSLNSLGIGLSIVLVVLLYAGVLWSQDAEYMDNYTGADAAMVGDAACTMCHADQAPGDDETHVSTIPGDNACEGCHGPGGNHNGKAEGILDFTLMPADAVTETCAACHEEIGVFKLSEWEESTHLANDVACANCHGGHNTNDKWLNKADIGELCGSCHEDEAEAYVAAEHGGGAHAGGMTCANCHNPHK